MMHTALRTVMNRDEHHSQINVRYFGYSDDDDEEEEEKNIVLIIVYDDAQWETFYILNQNPSYAAGNSFSFFFTLLSSSGDRLHSFIVYNNIFFSII